MGEIPRSNPISRRLHLPRRRKRPGPNFLLLDETEQCIEEVELHERSAPQTDQNEVKPGRRFFHLPHRKRRRRWTFENLEPLEVQQERISKKKRMKRFLANAKRKVKERAMRHALKQAAIKA